jgi:hypothetical protein
MTKWIPSEAVQFLEEEYDDLVWDFVDSMDDRFGSLEGLDVTKVVRFVNGQPRIRHRRYMSPMFSFKDHAETGPSVDIWASQIGWHCVKCEYGLGHRCTHCNAEISHMAKGLCVRCWSKNVDLEPDPPG